MITFFRKIRKGLIDSSQARKYLIYAIGETSLVVIGILIALQINNWNEWRKDRLKEVDILNALAQNLEINVQTIESNIKQLHLFNKSSKIILSVLDNRMPYSDSLDRHFHRSRVPKIDLHVSQAGYEQYKQAGFTIIRNKSLRDEVLNFFESTFPAFFIDFRQVNESYVPFIDHHVPLFIYKREELKPINFQALYDDEYFIGWLRAYMEGRNSLIIEITAFLDEIKRLLQLINDELPGAYRPG